MNVHYSADSVDEILKSADSRKSCLQSFAILFDMFARVERTCVRQRYRDFPDFESPIAANSCLTVTQMTEQIPTVAHSSLSTPPRMTGILSIWTLPDSFLISYTKGVMTVHLFLMIS
ncbi:hypothetical protein J6590_021385 [Homalodisca vitripennis]|nr:hypothetical protein J6590_021385 [Homalodisca vitripennis]